MPIEAAKGALGRATQVVVVDEQDLAGDASSCSIRSAMKPYTDAQ